MVYTGHVEVGGPADVRELPRLIISKIAVGEFNNNSYLLRCRQTGSQLLIDAAAEPDRLIDLVGDGLDFVITTHMHKDHWQALGDVVAATGATTIAHPTDAAEIPIATDVTVDDGDVIGFGAIELSVSHLVGHTDGSIALTYDDPDGHIHCWTGDCLFPGGVGNTWKDANRFDSLFRGVKQKIFDRYPDDTWVYPGHGHDTTLGQERPHLPEWEERGW